MTGHARTSTYQWMMNHDKIYSAYKPYNLIYILFTSCSLLFSHIDLLAIPWTPQITLLI